MIPRTLSSHDHEAFRDSVRRFVAEHVVPHPADWEKAGQVPRELWLKAGELGLLCCNVPEAYGGMGGDFLHSADRLVLACKTDPEARARGVSLILVETDRGRASRAAAGSRRSAARRRAPHRTRICRDARMCRIGGGTAEVMKQIIGNALLPKVRKSARAIQYLETRP